MAPDREETGTALTSDEPINGDKKNGDGNQLVVDETDDDDGNHAYVCFSWKPAFLQFLASGRFFCVLLCMVVASDAFNSGTFGSAVTSLETRYKLPSSQLGFINSMYELASLVLVIFVVYYGGKPTSNRPIWIGLGSILMGIGALVALLPQFIYGAYVPLIDSSNGNGNTSTATCSGGGNTTEHCTESDQGSDEASNHAAFVFIICGQIIVGLGWTPVMALGMSYIDDNVKTTTSAMYIGYVQSMFGFGRIIGFLIGGITVRKWVDFYRDDPDNYGVGPKDPQWVGAWWLGLIIASVSYIISGIPFVGFPRSLPKNYEEAHDDFMGHSKRDRSNGSGSVEKASKPKSKKKAAFKSIKEMPGKFWETCKNPLYLTINMAFVTEFAAQIGLNIFFPKYLETEFGLTSSYANLITGATLVPAAALGSIVGGFIVKKFKTKAEGSCKVALVLSAVAMVLLLITFGVGCRTIPTAGVTTMYPDQSPGTSLIRSSTCNAQCGCNDDIYSPVCGDDGITYVSACHAGCMLEFDNGTFGDCSCISNDGGVDTAVDGSCGNNCKTLIPFLVISFLVVIISGAEEIPQTLIAMRCVDPDSKAIALGIRAIMMRLLGAIPAPLIYGVMIDTACRLWQTDCGKQGSCYIYDLAAFRYAYLGVNFIFKVLTVFFYIVSLWLIRRQRMRNQNGSQLEEEEANETGTSDADGLVRAEEA